MRATEKWITDAGLDEIVLIDAWGEVAWGEVESALLKPEHWQAVGKTRGWGESCALMCEQPCIHDRLVWKRKWLEFIRHLADGLTVDEALSALEK